MIGKHIRDFGQTRHRIRFNDDSILNQEINDIMSGHYLKMKKEAGLENASCSSEDMDEETEGVF